MPLPFRPASVPDRATNTSILPLLSILATAMTHRSRGPKKKKEGLRNPLFVSTFFAGQSSAAGRISMRPKSANTVRPDEDRICSTRHRRNLGETAGEQWPDHNALSIAPQLIVNLTLTAQRRAPATSKPPCGMDAATTLLHNGNGAAVL